MTCAWENTLEIHMTRTLTLNSTPGPLLGRLMTYHSFQLEEKRNAKNVLTFCFKLALRSVRFKKVPLTTDVKISLRARFCSPAIRKETSLRTSCLVRKASLYGIVALRAPTWYHLSGYRISTNAYHDRMFTDASRTVIWINNRSIRARTVRWI